MRGSRPAACRSWLSSLHRGARGLFDLAIVESGSFALNQQTLAVAEANGEAFAAKVGCTDQTAAWLPAVPVSTLVANQASVYIPGVIDGTVLTQSVGAALSSGQFNRVPIINGTNSDEERLFVEIGASVSRGTNIPLPEPVTASSYQSVIASVFDVPAEEAATVAAEYPLGGFANPALAFMRWTRTPTLPVLRSRSTAGRRGTYRPSCTRSTTTMRHRATHRRRGVPPHRHPWPELRYLFNLPTAPIPETLDPDQAALASTMRRDWATFAAIGVRVSRGQVPWRPFGPHSEAVQSLVPPRPQLETNFAIEHHCDFWASSSSRAYSSIFRGRH